MSFLIVPTAISSAINAKLDAAFQECPEAKEDRRVLYEQLLDFYDEHGYVPNFELEKKEN